MRDCLRRKRAEHPTGISPGISLMTTGRVTNARFFYSRSQPRLRSRGSRFTKKEWNVASPLIILARLAQKKAPFLFAKNVVHFGKFHSILFHSGIELCFSRLAEFPQNIQVALFRFIPSRFH